MKSNKHWFSTFVNYSGWLMLLLGIFFSIKFIFNLVYYKEYPLNNIFFFPFYPKTQEECYQQSFYPLYDEKGITRKPNQYEEELRKNNYNNCINQLKNNRKEAKIRDFWLAFGFIFVGGGVLLTKKLYLK